MYLSPILLVCVHVLQSLTIFFLKYFCLQAAAAAATASVPAVTTGADVDGDELVDETGVEPKDIELIMSQVTYV